MDSGNYTYEPIKRGLDEAILRGKAMTNLNIKNIRNM